MPTALSIVRKFYPEVQTVVDGEEDVEVEVTKKDTLSKAVKNHKKCAMAVACENRLGYDGAVISLEAAYLVKGTEATRLKVPPSVQREVVSFDRDGGFVPGTYKLKAPDKWHKLGYAHSNSGRRTATRKRSKTARHLTENVRANLLTKAAVA